ncbi:MAG: V-type ATP synthase subunit A, partial [Tetragenococcus koreensis]|nr:V-type ATP synthase subunit A [Tetragenococcus koreensis]
IISFYNEGINALDLGGYLSELLSGTSALRDKIARMKNVPEDNLQQISDLQSEIKETIRDTLQKGDMAND